jgi:chaperonin GroES
MALIESTVGPKGIALQLDDDLDGDEAITEPEAKPHVPAPKPTKGDTLQQQLIDQIEDVNLARYMTQDDLDEIGILCVREYEIDEISRKDWETRAQAAMDFATQEPRRKETPWPGASSMVYPLITQAALDFNARTYPAIVQNRNVVKGTVWGTDRGTPATVDGKENDAQKMAPGANGQPEPVWLIAPGEKRKRADRIGEHMSWQLLTEMPEWEPQTDQLLMQIPIIGGAIRKTFHDELEKRNKSLLVGLLNIVWNYHAPSFEAAPRITEKVLLYPHEIHEYEVAEDEGDGGMFLELPYGVGGSVDGETFNGKPIDGGDNSDDDAPHLFLEQHRRLDLDEDGYAEPYVVTIHRRSSKVVRIMARYRDDGITASDDGDTILRIKPVDHYTLYPFLPNAEGGSYPMGFGHILRSLNEAINTTLNQMFDAGTLQNSGGGFISDQLNIPSGQTLFQVGKFARVNTKGQSIRDSVFPIPFQGPSSVLFQLLGVITEAGEKIAGIGNILSGDAAVANAPPTTILALIEQGMKFYTAIAKRVFRAEKQELQKLFELNRLHLTEPAEYQFGDEWREVTPEDYRVAGGVEPVADPTMTTDMQRLGRAQIVLTTCGGDPAFDQMAVKTRLLEAASIDRIDELRAPPPDPQQAQMMQQFTMAKMQAELGESRAKELKDQTQAFLNMALARKNATAGEEAQIEAQLTVMRLNIEQMNAQTRADALQHQANMDMVDHQHRRADRALEAIKVGDARHMANAAAGAPGPDGEGAAPLPFPAVTAPAPVGPDVVSPSSLGTGNPNVPSAPSPAAIGAGPSGPPAQSIPDA